MHFRVASPAGNPDGVFCDVVHARLNRFGAYAFDERIDTNL
jgi:hypothetical protein